MVDPTKINMNELSKKFIDGAIGAHAKGVFYFTLTSGNSLDSSFAAIPQTMKSIAVWMDGQVKKYEETFGEIDMTPPKISSPLQMGDFKKSGDGDKGKNK